MRELLPTTRVATHPRMIRDLPLALRDDLNRLEFTPLNSEQGLGWQDFFDANYTDGNRI